MGQKLSDKNRRSNWVHSGFTIVELLIVIVVIAILAAISVVAYTGVQNRANDSAVRSDLRQFGQQLEMFKTINDRYPTPETTAMADLNIHVSKNAYSQGGINDSTFNMIYCHTGNGSGRIAIIAVATSGKAYQYNGGVSQYNGRMDTTSTSVWCQDAGAPITGTINSERTIVRSNANNWASWIQ